jgi:hypothetical protein
MIPVTTTVPTQVQTYMLGAGPVSTLLTPSAAPTQVAVIQEAETTQAAFVNPTPMPTQAAQAPSPVSTQAAQAPISPQPTPVSDQTSASISLFGLDTTKIAMIGGGVGGIAATIFVVKLMRSRTNRVAPVSDSFVTTGNLNGMRTASRGSITINVNGGGMFFMDPSGQNGGMSGNRSIQIGMPVSY